MTETMPPEGDEMPEPRGPGEVPRPQAPDEIPPQGPSEEGLPDDEQEADHSIEVPADQAEAQEHDAERALSNKLGVFGSGRSG